MHFQHQRIGHDPHDVLDEEIAAGLPGGIFHEGSHFAILRFLAASRLARRAAMLYLRVLRLVDFLETARWAEIFQRAIALGALFRCSDPTGIFVTTG
jgi:hypothetical protein